MQDEELLGSLLGRTASTYQELYELYRRQAALLGFSVKLSTTKRYAGTQKVRVKYFRCSAEGYTNSKQKATKTPSPYIQGQSDAKRKRKPKEVPETRCGCKALMKVKYCKDTSLYIVDLHYMNHTHPYTRPEWQHLHRVERKITPHKATAINAMEYSGMKPTVAFRYMAYNSGGVEHVGHTARDQINYINRLRAHETGGADAQHVVHLLQRRQQEDPEFYYDMLIDT